MTRDCIVEEIQRYESLIKEENMRLHLGYGLPLLLQYYEGQLNALRKALALEEQSQEGV